MSHDYPLDAQEPAPDVMPPQNEQDVPAGFRRHARPSGLLDLLGPVYTRGAGETFEIGVRVDRRHLNGAGTLHAGVISTLADLCIGYGLATSHDPPIAMTTASLTVNISAAARENAWVVAAASVQHRGSRTGLGNCSIEADGNTIARASGVYVAGATSVRSPAR